MFSAPVHTIAQRAAFIDLLARRSDEASSDGGDAPPSSSGQTRVRIRAGRVIQRLIAVSAPAAAVDFDLAALAGGVVERLHENGFAVTPDQSERFERSLQQAMPASRRELYFTTRSIFLTDDEQLATFNLVFAQVFGAPAGADRHRENEDAQVVAGADRETEYARVVVHA